MNWVGVLTCLLVAGQVSSHALSKEETLVYDYDAVVLSGIPEVANQYAVFGVNCKVMVQAQSETKLAVELKDIRVAKDNKILTDISPENIDIRFSQSSAYANLTKTFLVEFHPDGTISKYYFDRSDPEWSRNLKIGVGSTLELRKQNVHSDKMSNHNRQDEQQEVGTVVEVMEPTLSGNCITIYDYKRQLSPEKSENDQMKITKVRDSHNCVDRPYFAASTHRRFKCDDCETDDSHPFSSNIIYKYDVEVDQSGEYIIKKAIADGIVRIAPLGQEADAISIIHNRTLTYKGKNNRQPRINLSRSNWVEETPYSNLENKTINIRNPQDLNTPTTYRELCEDCESLESQARALIRKTVSILEQHPSADDLRQVLENTVLIQRAMISMSFSEFQQVYRQLGNSQHAKKLFWDTVSITATNPAIKLIIWATESKALRPDEATQLLPVIAGHCANPNTLLMDKMLEFCQSSAVQSDDRLAATCYLSVGSMIAKTCAGNAYEVPLTSEETCPKGKRATYVKAFERLLQQTDDEMKKIALISGLGNTAMPEILDVIEKFVRADNQIPKVVQTKAIYALIPLAHQQSELVRELLTAVLFNSGDNLEARTAALDVLVASRPSRHLYEKIAMMTKYEEETTLCAYIYQTFKSLANATNPCLADVSSHASHALNLMDRQSDTSEWVAFKTVQEGARKYVDADSFFRLVTMGDAGALVPSRLYLQLENLISNYRSALGSIGIQANNTGYLVDTLLGSAALLQDKPLKQRIESLGQKIENMGLDKLSEKIGYLARRQPEFSAYVHTRFMDFQQTMHQINKETLLQLFQQQQRPRSAGDSPLHVSYDVHKTMMPLDVFVVVPIDIGLDVRVIVKTPVHLRMKVDLKVEYDPRSDKKSFDVDFRIQSTLAARASISAGVLLPDRKELVGAGYDVDFVAAPLIAAKAKVEMSQKKLSVDIKPAEKSQSSDFKVMSFETRPYTMINPILDLKRIEECSKTIHNMGVKQQQKEIELIKNSLTLKLKDEQYWHDRGSLFNYKLENTKLAVATLSWATQQWVKREYQLVWKKPQLPQISFEMDWSYQPAKCDPDKHAASFSYILWRKLFGFADVPLDCEYQDDGSARSYSSSEQFATSSEQYYKKSRGSNEYGDDYDSYGQKSTTAGDYDYQSRRSWGSQQSQRKQQQRGSDEDYDSRSSRGSKQSQRQQQQGSDEDYETDFGIFKDQKSQGRWWGWRSYKKQQQGSDEDYSGDAEHRSAWKSRGSDEDRGSNESGQSGESGERKYHHSRSGADSLSIDKSKLGDGIAVWSVNVQAKVKSNVVRGYKSTLIIKENRQNRQTSVDLAMTPIGNQGSDKSICWHSEHDSQKPPCFFGGAPDLKSAKLSWKSTLAWGQDCSRPEGHIEWRMTSQKSQEQLNTPDSERPSCYLQCKKDKATGHHMSHACMEVVEDQSRLNRVLATIKYSKLPVAVANFTQQLEDLAIFTYYPYLSHDFVARNQEQQVKVDLKFRYNVPVMDVQIECPQETLQFAQVPFPKFFPSVAVPSIAKSRLQRFIEEKTKGAATPTCTVSDRYVDTFSNLTYRFIQREQCEYVIAGDCSSSNMFAISFKNNSQGSRDNKKTLIIKFLRNTIEINPSDSRRDIVINNQPANAEDKTVLTLSDKNYGPKLIAYLVKSSPLYKFTMPFNRIGLIFDGVNVKLQTSNQWRKKMCGLCGEYDASDDPPFMGPNKCAYKKGNDFAQSYAFPTQSCPAQRPPKDVPCDVDTSYRHVANSDSCYTQRHIVKQLGGKICVSEDQHLLCKDDCRAEETRSKTAEFYCVSQSDSRIKNAHRVDSLKSLVGSQSTQAVSINVEVPTRCVSRQ